MGQLWSSAETIKTPIPDVPIEINDLKGHAYPFENLVLEGGGAKTFSYSAAFQVLENVGILPNIKRIAGASGGAVAAALLATGYRPDEIESKFKATMKDVADAPYGYFSVIPNLLATFGWHPGNKALASLEQAFGEKTGNGKITFRQLYDLKGLELCIVATNISSMSPEYFHPKTTPDVTIAEAVRMSVSIPGFMAPYRHRGTDGKDRLFVDGGVLCNYPIHSFDGWFLSMDPDNSFFKMLGCSDERPFGAFNDKTIGMVVYAADEVDVMKLNVHDRLYSNEKPNRPDTLLARSRGPKMDEVLTKMERKSCVLQATKTLMKAFQEHDIDNSGTVDMQELQNVIDSDNEETKEALSILFGTDFHFATIKSELDADQSGDITFKELINYLERKEQVGFDQLIAAISGLEINSLTEFLFGILDTWQVNGARRFIKDEDMDRTIGIYTDYLKGLDLDMEDADLTFLRRQGEMATVSFLRQYLETKNNQNHQKKGKSKRK